MPRSKVKPRVKKHKGTVSSLQATGKNHLTLQQEARNTEGRSSRRVDTSLRHHVIQFVSAGNTPSDLDQEKSPRPPEPLYKPQDLSNVESSDAVTISSLSFAVDHDQCHFELPEEDLTPRATSDIATSWSPNTDDSSEDEVVFSGRRNQVAEHTHRGSVSISVAKCADIPSPADDKRRTLPPDICPESVPPFRPDIAPAEESSVGQGLGECPDYISLKVKRTQKKEKTIRRHSTTDEDAVLADYIANMDDEYSILQGGRSQDRGSEAYTMVKTGHSPRFNSSRGRTDRATSSRIEAARRGSSKECVDRAGCNDLEVRLTTQGLLIAPGTDGYRESSQLIDNDPEHAEGGGLNSTVLPDSSSDIDSAHGNEWETRDPPSDVQQEHDEEESMFASANAFADALDLDPYYGFDIMDFNRPSLKQKPKRTGRGFNAYLPDSDLEAELLSAWETDRAKKKSRKQQREQLRSEGLLGRRNGEPDLRVKYAKGMDSTELKMEIRLFLLSTKHSLVLPPMAKQQRKLVHELANMLCLTSQSRGKGTNRFPIMNKTSRTPGFTQQTIPQLERILSKGKYVQRGSKSWDHKATKPAKARRGRPDASATYMDGEVVGASAPEIGAGNRGRAILEKMGWSIGTPLGATNNKGILQPVAHVVKNSRAGLG
ncbi:putative R3H and G-patch domain protein [Aspergillus brunneoviolaceus CBS 621.78]|uniref:Uncharacterized protein n=1 Tax=Aspergillus brunneoviolaceus CBS 621.78 TaxID=1450534 RepID=A0ACD1GGB5_9EURO|nr:hypothetical protein BO95DRAFT_440421 [Aspergillus brunneoviolaceus CBS 621.78]RAH48375.1 hypothetical protein BO95DRAFT_440421 [Aspergillus brunneoviolaceus CBS 621.78]